MSYYVDPVSSYPALHPCDRLGVTVRPPTHKLSVLSLPTTQLACRVSCQCEVWLHQYCRSVHRSTRCLLVSMDSITGADYDRFSCLVLQRWANEISVWMGCSSEFQHKCGWLNNNFCTALHNYLALPLANTVLVKIIRSTGF